MAKAVHYHTHVHICVDDIKPAKKTETKAEPKAVPAKKAKAAPAMDYNAGLDMFTPAASPEYAKNLSNSFSAFFGTGKSK